MSDIGQIMLGNNNSYFKKLLTRINTNFFSKSCQLGLINEGIEPSSGSLIARLKNDLTIGEIDQNFINCVLSQMNREGT